MNQGLINTGSPLPSQQFGAQAGNADFRTFPAQPKGMANPATQQQQQAFAAASQIQMRPPAGASLYPQGWPPANGEMATSNGNPHQSTIVPGGTPQVFSRERGVRH